MPNKKVWIHFLPDAGKYVIEKADRIAYKMEEISRLQEQIMKLHREYDEMLKDAETFVAADYSEAEIAEAKLAAEYHHSQSR